MSYADEKLSCVERELGAGGAWEILKSSEARGSFGNRDVALTNGEFCVRFSLDRGVEHVDLARTDGALEVRWFPLETVAAAANLRTLEELREHYRCCCDSFDDDTGRFGAPPLFEDVLSEIGANWHLVTTALADAALLSRTQSDLAALVQGVLDDIEPKLQEEGEPPVAAALALG